MTMYPIILTAGLVLAATKTVARAYVQKNEGSTAIFSDSDYDDVPGRSILEAFNAVVDREPELGTPVARFSTKAAGIKRLNAIVAQLNALVKSGEEIGVPIIDSPATPNAADRKASERWRAPKQLQPGSKCYMPRKNSLQHKMYELLNGDGCTPEAFAKMITDNRPKSTKTFLPIEAWAVCGYLFNKQKGWGLDFDGTTIKLVPAAEVA